MFLNGALYQNCTNGFAPLNRVGRALDKKYFHMKSPDPLVQNQNNFTEMVLILPSPQIDQLNNMATRT